MISSLWGSPSGSTRTHQISLSSSQDYIRIQQKLRPSCQGMLLSPKYKSALSPDHSIGLRYIQMEAIYAHAREIHDAASSREEKEYYEQNRQVIKLNYRERGKRRSWTRFERRRPRSFILQALLTVTSDSHSQTWGHRHPELKLGVHFNIQFSTTFTLFVCLLHDDFIWLCDWLHLTVLWIIDGTGGVSNYIF